MTKTDTVVVPAGAEHSSKWLSRFGPLLAAVLPLTFFAIAFWFLNREFGSLRYTDVVNSFHSLPWTMVVFSILLTAANYVTLFGYDWLAVRDVAYPLTNRQIAITSSLSYAFSNTLGTILGGTPIRVRLYSSWGMPTSKIMRLLFSVACTFWVGLSSLAGFLFFMAPFKLPENFDFGLESSKPLGAMLLSIAVVFFAISALTKKPIKVLSLEIQPPPLKFAITQAFVAGFDFLLAAATLYVLLPPELNIAFFPFVSIFLLAIVLAVISHVPGGLGVLELVLVSMLPETPDGSLVASLLAFRVIYYLLPLLIAFAAISVTMVRQNHQRVVAIASTGGRWVQLIGPRVITASVFIAGLVLLVSGTLPAAEGRMQYIRQFMPLPLIEMSHFAGSLIGAMLLILARGLQKRIDVAWLMTVVLLAFGSIVSLVKGFDYEEALILLTLCLALLPCRSQFYRRGHLLSPTYDYGWLAAILMSIGLMVWILLFAYRDVDYQNHLWWQFTYASDAPRSMRAMIGVTGFLALLSMSKLFRSQRHVPQVADQQQLQQLEPIVKASPVANANLALLGDKRLIFSGDKTAFVMFGCQGNSWISMGDPIGPIKAANDAAWNFREACDAAGVHPVFYQVDESNLSRYIEMGLSLIKIGEEARVPLNDFSLEGSSRKDLRRSIKKGAEIGFRFEILKADEHHREIAGQPLVELLQSISDRWLLEKNAGEKGFSLGNFSLDYIKHFDIALVWQNDQPIGFANLWLGANRSEISVDLMRYVPGSPYGVMEYLFTQLMLWGRQENYAWFNLGMAPLSGVQSHRLSPLWNRVSSLIYQHGEQFYNFQGLRVYKTKFGPTWFPKYLASPGGFAAPQAIVNASTLISGGVIKLLKR